MKKFLHSFLVSIVCIYFVSGILYASPPSPPDGFPAGGLFARYFTNIIGGSLGVGTCPSGEMIIGFQTGSSILYGIPICKKPTEWGISIATDIWQKNGDTISYTGGNVGIGGGAGPNTSLKINGEIQIGNNNNICTSNIAGSIRYNASLKVLEFCDGTDWGKIQFQQTTFPLSLSLTHSSRSKDFMFSWTAGNGNGASCKLQYYKNGNTWTDVSAIIYNCDTNLSNINVTLPDDGWYTGNWNETQIQIVRTSDMKVLGTFPQTLSCTSVDASSSNTPSIDEDCNGVWDNSSSYQSSYSYDCSYNSCYDTTCSRQVWNGTYTISATCNGRGDPLQCTTNGGIAYTTGTGPSCSVSYYVPHPGEASYWTITSCTPNYSTETYSCQQCNYVSQSCIGYSTSYNYY